jgi:hypothetical protein
LAERYALFVVEQHVRRMDFIFTRLPTCADSREPPRADLDLKRQALSQVFPDALAPPPGGRLLIDRSDVVGWLRWL